MLDFYTRNNQTTLDNWRLAGTPRIVAYLASESDCTNPLCGWDEFTQSGKLMDCAVCGGDGKIITFQEHTFRARVVWGAADLRYMQPTPGVEIGDVYLGIVRGDNWLITKLLESQRSYLVVDGKTVRPTSVNPSVVPNVGEGYLVSCKLYTPSSSED